MSQGLPFSRFCAVAVSLVLVVLPLAASANIINEEKDVYFIRPVITEPAWTQTGVYFNSFMFDMPNAVSAPNPQVGFVFTPGLTWSLFDILEINVAFPMVVNPDESGSRELRAGDKNASLKTAPTWDDHPDFDVPGLVVGLKGVVWGFSKSEDKFHVAIGVQTSIPLFSKWQVNFMPPKTAPYHTNTFRLNPYLSLGYDIGKFSPQLQLGLSVRWPDQYYDPNKAPGPGGSLLDGEGYYDFFFNLALPFAFLFEGTAPMIELNGVVGKTGTQLFITPAVTFLPKRSPTLISFACMLPIADTDWRQHEGFRFMINFSYRFDALGLPRFWEKEQDEGKGVSETPPAGW